jgi:hypothetical protein
MATRLTTFAPLGLVFSLLLVPSSRVLAVPAHLESPHEILGFSRDDISDAAEGAVVREVDSEGGRELIVAGIVEIDAPPSRVAAEIRRTRGLIDRKALKQSGSFGKPPGAADVASYKLPKSDIEALADCSVGDCKFKVRASRIEQLARLDWSATDLDAQVNQVVREAMLEYVTDYLAQGKGALAVYADKAKPESIAEASTGLMRKAAFIQRSMPEVDRYFEEFPNRELPGGEGLLHWSVQDYGYRPVTAVTHTLVYEPSEVPPGEPEVLIVQKHLFTTHYFLARIEFSGLFADGSDRTYLIYVDRSIFDDEVGGFKRSMLVRGVRDDVAKRMNAVRDHMAGR